MEQQTTIGTRLKALRELKEKSCAEVVMALDHRGFKVSRESLDKWERDQRVPNAEAVIALAKYYNVTTDYLIGYSPVEQSADQRQITERTLGLSPKAVDNLIQISNLRGGRAADLLSDILESPMLMDTLRVLVEANDGIARQIRYIRDSKEAAQNSMEGPYRPQMLRLMGGGLDMGDMYIVRALKQIHKMLRAVLKYDELWKEAHDGEHPED